MGKTKYNQYQKTIRSGAWKKFTKEWGVKVTSVSLFIAIAVGVSVWETYGLESLVVALAVLGLTLLCFMVFYLGYFHREHVVTYNSQNEEIKRLNEVIENADWSSVIGISPGVRVLKEGNKLTHGITIINKGSNDLLDCFADLETVVWAPQSEDGKWFSGSRTGFHGRLSWIESNMQSQDCKRRIESNNAGTSIRVVEEGDDNELILRLCTPELTFRQKSSGELRLLIRIGGTYNGKSVNPIFVAGRIGLQPRPQNAQVHIRGGLAVQKLNSRDDFSEYTKKWDYIHMEYDEKDKKAAPKKKKGSPHKRGLPKDTKKGN